MPGPRDARIQRLSGGATLITATAHLAWAVVQQFDQHQLSLGKRAWESADVLSWRAWLERTWRGLGDDSRARPTLLNDWQLAAVWEDLIRRDIGRRAGRDAPLWNLHATAKSAVDAWRILNAWDIDLAQCARSSRADHQCLVRWAKQFQRLCAARNWIDPHCLTERLRAIVGAGDAPGRVIPVAIELAGFDRLLPRQAALLAALKKAGVEVRISDSGESVNQTTETRHYPDETTQWLSAARWARQKLVDNPEARIAIIAPDLNKAAPAIEYALQQLLRPRQLAAPAAPAALAGRGANTDPPWHLSLGKPLSRHPLAGAALTALAPMAGRPLEMETLGQLMRSPFIRGADDEALARAELEAWCRRWLPWQMRFGSFLKELSDPQHPASGAWGRHCPILIRALKDAAALLEGGGKARAAGHWAHRFSEWLGQLGWPGERGLDSTEFQVEGAFRRELRNLALLDLTNAPMDAAAALGWLRRRVDEQPFQVESQAAPVQVLGVLEAAGQRFDHLWFGGLVEAHWPPAQRPNPFIAVHLQREAGVFESSLAASRERAAGHQAQIIASAGEVVLSRPRLVDNLAAEPSPLLAEAGEPIDVGAADFPTPANLIHAHQPEFQVFTDPRGPALAPNPGGAVKGGAALIENQAKCPFRAFAIHRLGARKVGQNARGLDAGERGSLIHRALQLAWGAIPSSAALHALSDDELREIIHHAAQQASRRYFVSSGCGERFHQTQVRWATHTLAEWFEVEKARAGAFTVSALEEEAVLNLDDLQLAFKADRIDRLENGGLALIDYKTGAPDSVTNWAGSRPQSPQLPLYAVAQEAPVEAVVYGRVRRGNCAFSGVARTAEPVAGIPGVLPLANHRGLIQHFPHWDNLMAHWRSTLAALAREFVDGQARVDPLAAAVCQQCDLHGLCRIGEEFEAENLEAENLDAKDLEAEGRDL